MKFLTPIGLVTMLVSLLGLGGGLAAPDSEKKKPAKKAERPAGEVPTRERGGGGDPLRNLTPEERETFRNAMRKAWNDPAVLQARDEVKEATMVYQKALLEAIQRDDPAVVNLMKKIGPAPDSPIKSLFAGPGRGRPTGAGGGFRDFESFLLAEPSFLKNLSDKQRTIYQQAREKALKSAEFQEVVGKLKELRKGDEALRNKRIELFGRVRKTLRLQMIRADGRVKDILPNEDFHPGAKRPGRKRSESDSGSGGDDGGGSEKKDRPAGKPAP